MHGAVRISPLSPRLCAVSAVVFFVISIMEVCPQCSRRDRICAFDALAQAYRPCLTCDWCESQVPKLCMTYASNVDLYEQSSTSPWSRSNNRHSPKSLWEAAGVHAPNLLGESASGSQPNTTTTMDSPDSELVCIGPCGKGVPPSQSGFGPRTLEMEAMELLILEPGLGRGSS